MEMIDLDDIDVKIRYLVILYAKWRGEMWYQPNPKTCPTCGQSQGPVTACVPKSLYEYVLEKGEKIKEEIGMKVVNGELSYL